MKYLTRPTGHLIRMLTVLYGSVVVTAVGIGMLITNYVATWALLFVLMGCLGMGNGSVFQLVPQRFKREIGVMTGLIGAAGGLGGFYLNVAMGRLHDATGSYASGFFAFAGIAILAIIVLRAVAPGWTRTWLGAGGVASTEAAPEQVTSPYPAGAPGAPQPQVEMG